MDQIKQSIFYFMSVHIEVISDQKQQQQKQQQQQQQQNERIIIIYTNFPTAL